MKMFIIVLLISIRVLAFDIFSSKNTKPEFLENYPIDKSFKAATDYFGAPQNLWEKFDCPKLVKDSVVKQQLGKKIDCWKVTLFKQQNSNMQWITTVINVDGIVKHLEVSYFFENRESLADLPSVESMFGDTVPKKMTLANSNRACSYFNYYWEHNGIRSYAHSACKQKLIAGKMKVETPLRKCGYNVAMITYLLPENILGAETTAAY